MEKFSDLVKHIKEAWSLNKVEDIKYVDCAKLDEEREVDYSSVGNDVLVEDLGPWVKVAIMRPVPKADGNLPTLFGNRTAPLDLAAWMLLTESSIEHHFIDVNVLGGDLETEQLKALSPLQQTPIFRTKSGVVLSTPNSVLRHIGLTRDASSYYGALEASERATVDMLLEWKANNFTPKARPFMPLAFSGTVKDDQAAKKALDAEFQILERHFLGKKAEFIAGSNVSIADFAIVPILVRLELGGVKLSSALQSYVSRFRSAVQASSLMEEAAGGCSMANLAQDIADAELLRSKAQLYLTRGSATCVGPWILVKESGIAHEIVDVDLAKGEQRSKKFLDMNPMHTVPVFKNPTGLAVFESNAIMRHIVSFYPSASRFSSDEPETRARIENALDWRQSHLYAHVAELSYPSLGIRDTALSEEQVHEISAKLDADFKLLCDHFLNKNQNLFIGGSTPSIADFAIVPCFMFLEATSYKLPAAVAAYAERFYDKVASAKAVVSGDGSMGMRGWIDMVLNHQRDTAAKKEEEEAQGGDADAAEPAATSGSAKKKADKKKKKEAAAAAKQAAKEAKEAEKAGDDGAAQNGESAGGGDSEGDAADAATEESVPAPQAERKQPMVSAMKAKLSPLKNKVSNKLTALKNKGSRSSTKKGEEIASAAAEVDSVDDVKDKAIEEAEKAKDAAVDKADDAAEAAADKAESKAKDAVDAAKDKGVPAAAVNAAESGVAKAKEEGKNAQAKATAAAKGAGKKNRGGKRGGKK